MTWHKRVWTRLRCAVSGHELVLWDQTCQEWLCLCGHRIEKGWDRLTWRDWGPSPRDPK